MFFSVSGWAVLTLPGPVSLQRDDLGLLFVCLWPSWNMGKLKSLQRCSPKSSFPACKACSSCLIPSLELEIKIFLCLSAYKMQMSSDPLQLKGCNKALLGKGVGKVSDVTALVAQYQSNYGAIQVRGTLPC